jgi:hypothetical protein
VLPSKESCDWRLTQTQTIQISVEMKFEIQNDDIAELTVSVLTGAFLARPRLRFDFTTY